jgi:formate dehydrogenase major subunit
MQAAVIILWLKQVNISGNFGKQGLSSSGKETTAMEITRREFLSLAGATAAGFLLSSCTRGLLKPVEEKAQELKPSYAKQVTTICPYCGVGCGAIVMRDDSGKVMSVEGDPDHPISEGSLCSKGSALYQIHFDEKTGEVNPLRLTKVLYRAPGSNKWVQKDWDWALDAIADRIKKMRDRYFIEKDSNGRVVNRLEAIAGLGGAALDNEECYLWSKLARSLGIVYLEHQARI